MPKRDPKTCKIPVAVMSEALAGLNESVTLGLTAASWALERPPSLGFPKG